MGVSLCLRDKKELFMSFYVYFHILMCSVYKRLSSVIYFVYPGLIKKMFEELEKRISTPINNSLVVAYN